MDRQAVISMKCGTSLLVRPCLYHCSLARSGAVPAHRVRETAHHATMISEGLALVASPMVTSDILNYLVDATVFGKVKTIN